jgi:hypothetical protein
MFTLCPKQANFMSIPFENYTDTPTAPSLFCFEITPDNSADLSRVTKALYIGEGGDVVLRSALGDTDVTFRNLPAGYILDVRVSAVRETGTTASALVGLA